MFSFLSYPLLDFKLSDLALYYEEWYGIASISFFSSPDVISRATVDAEITQFYHVINRCVRRVYLVKKIGLPELLTIKI